jgi:hypothetical protein
MKESAPRKTRKAGRGNYKALLHLLVTHQNKVGEALPKKKGIKK